MEISKVWLLKITKIKQWAIYFSYDGEKYILHESNQDYESGLTLYKKVENENKYTLEAISSAYGSLFQLKSKITGKYMYNNSVYNQVDLFDFVCKMAKRKLITSSDAEVELRIKREQKIQEDIKNHENKIRDLRSML